MATNRISWSDLVVYREIGGGEYGATSLDTQRRVLREYRDAGAIHADYGLAVGPDGPVLDEVPDATDVDWTGSEAELDTGSDPPAATTTHECAYCGATLEGEPPDPRGLDAAGWADEAARHADGCEWVATRAHTVWPPVPSAESADPNADGRLTGEDLLGRVDPGRPW